MEGATVQFRVRAGRTHGKASEYGPGDILAMTEREAQGFLDKLEPVAPDDTDVLAMDAVADDTGTEDDGSESPLAALAGLGATETGEVGTDTGKAPASRSKAKK